MLYCITLYFLITVRSLYIECHRMHVLLSNNLFWINLKSLWCIKKQMQQRFVLLYIFKIRRCPFFKILPAWYILLYIYSLCVFDYEYRSYHNYAWTFLVISLINDDFNRMNALHRIKKVAKLSSVCNYAKSLCTLLTELCFEPRHRDLC